jgi:SulP family sulfate permease
MLSGAMAGLLSLPRAFALGVLVLSPLGPDYLAIGMLAGVFAVAAANMASAFTTAAPLINSAPFSMSSLMLVASLQLALPGLQSQAPEQVGQLALMFVFAVVSLSGLIQILFGFLRIGELAKYIPHPVVAGMLDGTAILIILSQLYLLYGLPQPVGFLELWVREGLPDLSALTVVALTCLVIWGVQRLRPEWPAPMIGLLAGSAGYYLLPLPGLEQGSGLLGGLGEQPLAELVLQMQPFIWPWQQGWLLTGELLYPACALAAINSLRSLLVFSAAQELSDERQNSSRELIGQGIGNLAAGLAGGVSVAASLSNTLLNHASGGRSRLSRFVSGLFPLLAVALLYPVMAAIPSLVLYGVMVMVALHAFDAWSLKLLAHLPRSLRQGDSNALINMLMVVSVVAVLLVYGIFQALSVGLFIAAAWFIARMGKSIMRNEFDVSQIRSNTQRPREELEVLDRYGQRIRFLELEGSLFFGTADRVADEMDRLLKQDVDFIILDFRWITDIDTTGARLIARSVDRCWRRGTEVLLSSLGQNQRIHRELLEMVEEYGHRQVVFPDRDTALAITEDRLLDQLLYFGRYDEEIDLGEVELFQYLDPDQVRITARSMQRVEVARGEYLFHQGDPGNSFCVIVRGRARVVMQLPKGREMRLGTLCKGMIVGEMGLFGSGQRSADVYAVGGPLVCYRLSMEDYQRLNLHYPDLGFRISRGLGTVMARRILFANRVMGNQL